MTLGALPLLATLGGWPQSAVVFSITPDSRLEVKTGKSGLFGFAGHEHVIRARGVSGSIVYRPEVPDSSTVQVRVSADSLEVLTPPDTEEIRKVTAAMRSEVLEVASYPEVRLESRTVRVQAGTAHLVAALTLHGQTRDVPIDVQFAVNADTLTGVSQFVIKQTDFGIRPFRGGPGGTVRVANEVTFDIHIIAVRRD